MPEGLDLHKFAAPAFVVLWSTGFVGAKFGLPHAEPMTFLALRFLIVAAILFSLSAWWGEFRQGRFDWGRAAIIGALIHACYLGGVFTAIWLGVGAALTALIVGLQPIITTLFARYMIGEKLGRLQWAGMILGLFGVALAVWRKVDLGEASPEGVALCLFGLIAISFGSVMQKTRPKEPRIALDTGYQFLAAGLICALVSFAFETQHIDWTVEFFIALGWMTVALSLGAVSILYYLIRRGGVSKTASMFFLIPGTTALMARAMFGESFGLIEIAGFLIAAIGVALVVQPARAST